MNKIAFTTSIPVEIILAAGKIPVDLNNLFISAQRPQSLVEIAEEAGYPRNTCGWIKGLYSVSLESDMEAIIAVMQGDCSNTQALMETLQLRGLNIIPFAFPFDRDREMLKAQINKMMNYFQVSSDQVAKVKSDLDGIRQLCIELDDMTWRDNLVSGFENHYYLVSSSDFNGNPDKFARELQNFISTVRKRKPLKEQVRLAYIGVPPIFPDIYDVLETMGARVVFNEIQRQFSMPAATDNIVEQYLIYTYPYGAFARLRDIEEQLAKRKVDGIIHYTQTFCFRQIEDLIYREKLKLPFLTVEGDKPGKVDARTRMRLESFVNMLKR
ncbi:MAG: 2-hydroxyacyl-CoA dehydratase [Syntrophomonadaceae bacterium]|nr:2-hydroxyacyl-CoA dehydratase [Syntrophomonadaceae bacterium]